MSLFKKKTETYLLPKGQRYCRKPNTMNVHPVSKGNIKMVERTRKKRINVYGLKKGAIEAESFEVILTTSIRGKLKRARVRLSIRKILGYGRVPLWELVHSFTSDITSREYAITAFTKNMRLIGSKNDRVHSQKAVLLKDFAKKKNVLVYQIKRAMFLIHADFTVSHSREQVLREARHLRMM